MKKLIICILTVMMLILPASAQDELPDPGITPDNMLYPVDVFLDNVGVAFAFGNEAKINKQFENAEERLAEAQAMMEGNNTEAAEDALRIHNTIMEQVRSRVNQSDNATESLKLQLQVEEKLRIHEGQILEVATTIDTEQRDLMGNTLAQVGMMDDEVKAGKNISKAQIDNPEVVEEELEVELGINGRANSKTNR